MSDLKGFSDALRAAGDRREQERVEFNQKLGEPAHFIPSEDDPRFGVGFWKGDGGVFAYRKYASGYDPFSRQEYSNELIDLLVKIRR